MPPAQEAVTPNKHDRRHNANMTDLQCRQNCRQIHGSLNLNKGVAGRMMVLNGLHWLTSQVQLRRQMELA